MLGLGGGALDQMNKTLKHNREMLKRSIPKPFDKSKMQYEGFEVNEQKLKDAPPMSEMERRIFVNTIKEDRRRNTVIRYAILGSLLVIAVTLLVRVMF
jgi:hypothetical protein